MLNVSSIPTSDIIFQDGLGRSLPTQTVSDSIIDSFFIWSINIDLVMCIRRVADLSSSPVSLFIYTSSFYFWMVLSTSVKTYISLLKFENQMWNVALSLCLPCVFLKFLWSEYVGFNWELAGYFLKFQNLNEWETVISLNSPNSC